MEPNLGESVNDKIGSSQAPLHLNHSPKADQHHKKIPKAKTNNLDMIKQTPPRT